jgi:hypothetical protein
LQWASDLANKSSWQLRDTTHLVVFQNSWRLLHDGTNLHCGYPGGEAGSDRRIIAGIQFAARRDNLVSIVSSSKS